MKLVSVITPTYNRSILNCISMVKKQTYKNIEHVIVSDGPIREDVRVGFYIGTAFDDTIKLVELGYNTTQHFFNSFGIGPLVTGMMLASGDYQIWLSDDDTMDEDYIEKLVQLLESGDYGFVYSKCRFYWSGQSVESGFDIGTEPPRLGQITNFLYKKELLALPDGMPRFGTHPVDWHLVKQWMQQGVTYKMLDEVKFYHRADQR